MPERSGRLPWREPQLPRQRRLAGADQGTGRPAATRRSSAPTTARRTARQLSATIKTRNDKCDFPSSQPNSWFLVFIAHGNGGKGQQVPIDDSIQLVTSSFDGGLFATNVIQVNTYSDRGADARRHGDPRPAGLLPNLPLINVPIGSPDTTINDAPPDRPPATRAKAQPAPAG